MNNQTKKIVAWIVGVVVLIVVIIGGIFGVKHYMTEQTYEKPINAVVSAVHRTGSEEDKKVTKNNSKIVIYDDPNKENNYLITITNYSKEQSSTITSQFVVDKTTNHVENPDVKIPVSNLKKLYESDHLKNKYFKTVLLDTVFYLVADCI